MIADGRPEIPQRAADAFTRAVCSSELSVECTLESSFEWSWEEVAFDVSVLRHSNSFYLKMTDRAVERPVYSGPFISRDAVNDRIELLNHRPKVIRIVRREE